MLILVIVNLAVNALVSMPRRITIIHRNIATVGKHIIAQDALTGRCEGIRIEEPAYLRIIISGLKIIQPGFSIVALAQVATCYNYSIAATLAHTTFFAILGLCFPLHTNNVYGRINLPHIFPLDRTIYHSICR